MEHHPHDKPWLKEQFKKIPPEKLGYVMDSYSTCYSETGSRREANTKLREYIDKIGDQ